MADLMGEGMCVRKKERKVEMVGRVWKRRDREGWGGREDRVGKKER